MTVQVITLYKERQHRVKRWRGPRNPGELNKEGLTWEEWATAAFLPWPGGDWLYGHPAHLFRKERRAWRAGEDPCDWRAA